MRKKIKDSIVVIIIFLFYIILFVFSYYLHPVEESMICDENYTCKIVHRYFLSVKSTNIIQFSKNTTYSPVIRFKPDRCGRSRNCDSFNPGGYNYYHKFIEKDKDYLVFKNPEHLSSRDGIDILPKNYEKIQTQLFENYKELPYNYKLHVKCIPNDRTTDISFVLPILLCTFFLFCFITEKRSINKS